MQTLREMEEERRDLQKRLEGPAGTSGVSGGGQGRSKASSNFSTINEQAYKEYLVGRRKGSKGRPTEKLPERARRPSEKQNSKQTHFAEGAIQINLSNNIVVSKKNSYDQNLLRHHHPSNDSSIRGTSPPTQNSPRPCR
jgi:hypothetical protein